MAFSKKGISFDHEYDQQEKIHEKHIRRFAELRTKIREAEATGDQEAIGKAKEAFRNHVKRGDKLKEKAKSADYEW